MQNPLKSMLESTLDFHTTRYDSLIFRAFASIVVYADIAVSLPKNLGYHLAEISKSSISSS